jgi:hypothetical protein
MKLDFKPSGQATGIGSVPHTNAEEAVKFTLSYFPEIPYWPQLPARNTREGYLNQFLNPLVELGLVAGEVNKYYVDMERRDWASILARFYEAYLAASDGNEEALRFFKLPENNAAGFYAMLRYLESYGTGKARYIKGQIYGHGIGQVLIDRNRKPVYYDAQFRDVLVKSAVIQSLFQVKTLSRFGPPVLLFVDDGGICGTSELHNVQKNEVQAELNEIYEAIKEAGALTGTHCCGGGDWSVLLESKVDIISFDAYQHFASLCCYLDELKNYLNRGGVLAWGIVPTLPERVYAESVDTLIHRMEESIDYLVGIEGSTGRRC